VADSQATFDISLTGNLKAQSREAAQALAELKIRLKDNNDAVEDYRAELKALRSQGGDTSKQQAELKDKIDSLKKAMTEQRTAANGLRDRLGTLRDATREQAAASKEAANKSKELLGTVGALASGFKAAGGPADGLREKLKAFREIVGENHLGLITLGAGIALTVIAVAAVTTAVVESIVSFGKWAIGTADAARSLGLLQEAAAGSAENSAAMTSQIDAMARRVPTARAELQSLYQETYRLANNTTMSGQAIQDTYSAIAQSSAAMGDAVGKQIGELITRSKQFGVVRIGRLDVLGTGIDYEKDLVAPLARSLHKVGPITTKEMNEARSQLAIGGMKIDAGAKFVADAVNARFGSINMKQMLSLDVQWRRLKETFVSFTRGINLEPLLQAVQHFFAMFNTENDVGAALKQIVEVLGNGMVGAIAKGGPAAEDFFKSLVIDAQELVIAAYEGKKSLADMFTVDAGDILEDLKQLVALLKDAAQVVSALNRARNAAADFVVSAVQGATGDSGADLSRQAAAYAAGHDARMAVASGNVTTSPAHADGGVVGKPAPGEFWASVAPGETIVPEGIAAGGSGAAPITLNVTVNASGTGGKEVAASLSESSFLEKLTDSIERALIGAGIPTKAVPA
jgi:predicted  nucleic acid-binding Zn-ribbon protein